MDPHQTKIYTAILITALVIGSILIYFIVSLIQQQRRNSRLYTSKIQAEISTLENERTRIAGDLHDELGPLLSAIKLKLSSIETQSRDDEITMQQTSEHITDIIQRMREISNNLMPNTLLRKGLTYAIEDFINKFSMSLTPDNTEPGLKINFTQQDIPELPKEKEVNIYRMVQEIIHNTVKHAKASTLNITLKAADNKLTLVTEDNGTGFNYQAAVNEKSGLGLRNIISRCEIMQGNLYIESQAGKGTIYSIEIPIV
jgi:signal transduction histidine kinase